MSRSRKKVSIHTRRGDSMRVWRRIVNRRMRAMSKQALLTDDWDCLLMPSMVEASNQIVRPAYRPRWSAREWWSWWSGEWMPGEQHYREGFRK